MLRFRSLGSGSGGNALLIEAIDPKHSDFAAPADASLRVLVDCGLGMRELQARLKGLALCLQDLSAIFVTHEHSDHVGCAPVLAERLGIPLWLSHGTWTAIGAPEVGGLVRLARDGEAIGLGAGCTLQPFTVPHDAREPLQLVVSSGQRRLGICTDLGHASAHVVHSLQGCHALVLEANHDPELLAQSRYPAFLKRRVGGRHGHLSNEAAADLLAQLLHDELHVVVAAHLSEQNNRPELARRALEAVFGPYRPTLITATQNEGCGWIEV